YSKYAFMGADTLVLTNIDDLFEREELSAAPDPGWLGCINSGVFVSQASIEMYNQLSHLPFEQGGFDEYLVQMPKLCTSLDESSHGITFTVSKQKESNVNPRIPPSLIMPSLGEGPATPQPPVFSERRQEQWEQGQAEYMGADSYDNIKRKLDTYPQ
ncbi:hypothetical protein A6R68_13450, partial [Neotoma lepida]